MGKGRRCVNGDETSLINTARQCLEAHVSFFVVAFFNVHFSEGRRQRAAQTRRTLNCQRLRDEGREQRRDEMKEIRGTEPACCSRFGYHITLCRPSQTRFVFHSMSLQETMTTEFSVASAHRKRIEKYAR